MTVSTFYPDASPETTSVDGRTGRNEGATGVAWTTLRDGAGTESAAAAATWWANLVSGAASPNWRIMSRALALFYTASIPDGDIIDATTFEFVSTVKADNFALSLAMVLSTPATNTTIVAGDFTQLGTVRQAADITFASVTSDSATYNVMTLNATGRSNISKTGVTKLGFRTHADLDNLEPTWVASTEGIVEIASAEEALAGDKRPKLVITHTTPPVTFTPRTMVF